MWLLIDNDLITPMSIFGINLYAIADIEYFVKVKIKKHRNKLISIANNLNKSHNFAKRN